MGLQIEFNWYIVIKDKNVTSAQDHNQLDDRELQTDKIYNFVKEGHRIYPMDTPLPLIYNGKCIALACIEKLEIKGNTTDIYVQPTLLFKDNDTIALYYEESFNGYKREQQIFDDGGKVDIRQVVNPAKRMRV